MGVQNHTRQIPEQMLSKAFFEANPTHFWPVVLLQRLIWTDFISNVSGLDEMKMSF